MVWSRMNGYVGPLLVAAIVGAGAVTMAPRAHAADWQGLTVGQPGPGREKAFADAFHATAALARGGGRDVLMLRDVTADALRAAVATWPAGQGAIIYLSGALQDGRLRMKNSDLPLTDLLDALAARQVTRLALLVEDCAGRAAPVEDMATSAQDASAPDIAVPQRDDIDMLVAVSSGGTGACPSEGERLTDLLTRAPATMSLTDALGAMVQRNDLEGAVPVSETAAAAASPIIPLATVAPVIQPVITPVMADSRSNAALSPVQAVARPQETGTAGLLIFAPPPDRQRTALPRAAGLPEPSIIVGLVAPAQDSFAPAGDLGDLDLNAIAFDDLAARRGLQARDPALFASLVAGGALDPPDAQLPRALQEELARMGCYTAAIDGVWGNGSRAAVTRYFDERADAEPVTLNPEAPLFRQIVLRDDITCPAPAAAALRAPAPAASATRATPRAQQPAPRATQAAPAPQPAQTGTRRIQSGTALGVFR